MTKNNRLRPWLVLGVAAVVAVTAAATDIGVAFAKPVAPDTGTPACALTTAGLNQAMILSGSGFAADSQYVVYMTTVAGTGATTVNTDPSGDLVAGNFWTYWSGTYTAQLYTEGHHMAMVTSCSVTVP